MVTVQGVSRAGIIGVAWAVCLEDVVGGIIETAEAKRRAAMVSLRSVIEDNIEDDLQIRTMECFRRIAELIDRRDSIAARAIRLVRREKRHRRISPIIHLPGGQS